MNMKSNFLKNYPDVLEPQDLIEILGVNKNTVYKLLKTNSIQNVKIGKQYKIPKPFLTKFLLENSDKNI